MFLGVDLRTYTRMTCVVEEIQQCAQGFLTFLGLIGNIIGGGPLCILNEVKLFHLINE